MLMRVICFQWCSGQQRGWVSLLFNTFIIIMLLSISKQIHPSGMSQCGSNLSNPVNYIHMLWNVRAGSVTNDFSRPAPLWIQHLCSGVSYICSLYVQCHLPQRLRPSKEQTVSWLLCVCVCIRVLSQVLAHGCIHMFVNVTSGYTSPCSCCGIYCLETPGLVIKKGHCSF